MPVINRSMVVPYTPAQMYNLVNAIEHYPEFVPWCKSTQVLSRNEDEIRVTLEFARSGLHKSFTTLNRLQKDKMIELRLENGPFKQLEGFWRFEAMPDNCCKVSLDLEFEFASKLMAFAFEPLFAQVANMLVDVFRDRAAQVYGK